MHIAFFVIFVYAMS